MSTSMSSLQQCNTNGQQTFFVRFRIMYDEGLKHCMSPNWQKSPRLYFLKLKFRVPRSCTVGDIHGVASGFIVAVAPRMPYVTITVSI